MQLSASGMVATAWLCALLPAQLPSCGLQLRQRMIIKLPRAETWAARGSSRAAHLQPSMGMATKWHRNSVIPIAKGARICSQQGALMTPSQDLWIIRQC